MRGTLTSCGRPGVSGVLRGFPKMSRCPDFPVSWGGAGPPPALKEEGGGGAGPPLRKMKSG